VGRFLSPVAYVVADVDLPVEVLGGRTDTAMRKIHPAGVPQRCDGGFE
jgi:hypothetical protein